MNTSLLTEKDIEISQPPTDTVSELSFSPQADFLAASSWDNNVRIWEVQSNGMTAGKAMYTHEGPALTCDWSKDGAKIASGGADKAARMFDVMTGTTTQIAAHDAAIRCLKFVEMPNSGAPIVATGGWDKMIKYWDLRTQNPIGTVQLPERCYTMDVNHPLMVVGTADRHLVVIDLNNPTVPFKSYLSPLKFQTRTVSCFPSKDGFAIGSIEGRVAIQYIQDSAKSNEFSFKCHRDTSNNVFAVNCISHHPLFGTFSTAGSDGNIMFWDKEARQKLKSFPCVNTPITSTCFNRDGRIFAYSVGYDWSKGYAHSNQNDKRTIYLHSVKEDDVKPRKRR